MIVAASISFLSSFLCNCMDLKSSREIFPSFQKEEIKYQTISENYDLLFKQPRLQLSKETYKNLKVWKPKAKKTLQEKDTQYPATEPNVAHLQSKITKKKTKLNELTKNRDDLQKQCGTLQQQCIEQQEKQDKLNKECRKLETEMIKSKKKNDHLQSTVSSIQKQIEKKKENRQTKNEPTKRSEKIKIEYAVLKSLKYQYSAQTIEDLSDKFDKLSSDIHEGLELNLQQTGPYFNKNHLLIGSVNKEWIFVYCPCTSRIVISNESYSDQPDVLYNLPDYFECKSNCSNYRTSSSTNSDSDTENTEDQIVSKERMATF